MTGLISFALFAVWIFRSDMDVLLIASSLFAIANSISIRFGNTSDSTDDDYIHS